MGKISILDCTLRDGGYCNQWLFGEKNIHKIINGLVSADINIVECGFITSRTKYTPDSSKFSTLDQLQLFIPNVDLTQLFVAMINYGEYDYTLLPDCTKTSLHGIRVAFHKKDLYNAIEFCRKVKEKGYLLFIQPMVTMNYSDDEFIELLHLANSIKPYAFYIVDSFGTMRGKTLSHYYKLTQNLLHKEIAIGFHSHNNLQYAYSNAVSLLRESHTHDIIIDSSIYGMGRGAGNLNTELLINELNIEFNTKYLIKPILQLMDEIINYFYQKNPWGYSLPNYLSAAYSIHPNYAIYLCEKNTLTLDDMDNILATLNRERATEYDKSYIEPIYEQYMLRNRINNSTMDAFQCLLKRRKILLIGPGKNSYIQKNNIIKFAEKNNPIVISINHEYKYIKTDYIFVSNIRRYRELANNYHKKAIVTTNISTDNSYMTVDYYSLLNSSKSVKDNAGLMAIKFLLIMNCKQIYLAGYDGYEYDSENNYENTELELVMSKKQIDELNHGMQLVLSEFANEVSLTCITTSRFFTS